MALQWMIHEVIIMIFHEFPWFVIDCPLIVHWLSIDFYWCSIDVPVIFQWFFLKNPGDFPMISHDFQWFSRIFPLISQDVPWFSRIVPLISHDFPWFSVIFQDFSIEHDPLHGDSWLSRGGGVHAAAGELGPADPWRPSHIKQILWKSILHTNTIHIYIYIRSLFVYYIYRYI